MTTTNIRRTHNGWCNLQNAERDNSLLGRRKYIHASLNPNQIANPIANPNPCPKPYFNPKITQSARMESFYDRDLRFPADLVYCSCVLYLAFCTL